VNFTAGRVANHKCDDAKGQSFLWDNAAPGLGLRTTSNGAKSYIFQSKLNGKTLRITIGAPDTWQIPAAQAEARRLKVLIDNGQDPRQVKAEGLAQAQALRDTKEAEKVAMQSQQMRESITLGMIWPDYIAERTPLWSERHTFDHKWMIHAGGEKRSRSPKLTIDGPLASLAEVRLIDLTLERVEAWAKVEAVKRPTRARLALRMLRAFLFWCAAHPTHAEICQTNAAQSKKARESLGKPQVKNDVLQREQLPAWFSGVKRIGNPVIGAYLQCLLIIGSRREELANLRWEDVDFQWNSIRLKDKVEKLRMVPLTPYVAHLLLALPRRNEWVFSSPAAASGRLAEPRIAHNEALVFAGLPPLTLHGLRRSFASLCEWTETPAGIAAQIQGHAPQGVRETNYIRRPIDLLRKWHVKYEAWILEQAGIDFVPMKPGLRVATAAA
jgi:integrase